MKPCNKKLKLVGKWCGIDLIREKKVPSQREYVQQITGLDVKDNFKAYWLLQQARKPNSKAMKKLSQDEIEAVSKLSESEAMNGWQKFVFDKKYRIN